MSNFRYSPYSAVLTLLRHAQTLGNRAFRSFGTHVLTHPHTHHTINIYPCYVNIDGELSTKRHFVNNINNLWCLKCMSTDEYHEYARGV